MFKTLGALKQDVILQLGLVPGTGVQVYTEPQVGVALAAAFETMFLKRFWKHLTVTTEHDLDGIVGLVTDASINIATVDDIEWIRFAPFEDYNPVHYLAGREFIADANYYYDTLAWDNPVYADKLLQFYPKEYPGPIKIRARRRPTTLVDDTKIIPFDALCLTYFTVANMLAIDEMNPTLMQRSTVMFNDRYSDLVSAEESRTYLIGNHRSNTFTVAP